MRITILTVPDCPNTPVAAGRITAALAGRPASVELVEVTGEAEAARLGMTGSPTILLDGVDPFAAAGAVPSVSCRIYRGSDGAAAGAPSVQDLTTALSAAGATGDECCEADVPDAACRQFFHEQDARVHVGPEEAGGDWGRHGCQVLEAGEFDAKRL